MAMLELHPDERDLWERVYVAATAAQLERPDAWAFGETIATWAAACADRAVTDLRKRLPKPKEAGPYR